MRYTPVVMVPISFYWVLENLKLIELHEKVVPSAGASS